MAEMYKVVVLTDLETAVGFQLAGAEVHEAETIEDAFYTLGKLVEDETIGIIAVNQVFLDTMDERTLKRIESVNRPILVSLPVTKKIGTVGERQALLASLIHSAVGFDVILKEGDNR